MMKNILKLSIFILFITISFCDISFGVPANPDPIETTQPDGTKITIKIKGDEFYGWHEDKDGYTIIKDTTTRFWSYAHDNGVGDLISSKDFVGKVNPKNLSIKKSLRDKNKVFKANQFRREQSLNLQKISKSKINAVSSLNNISNQVNQTKNVSAKHRRVNLVLLVQFNDLKFKDNAPFSSTSTEDEIRAEFDELFNGDNYKKYGAVGSVKDYFKEVSYGNLEYVSVISPIITIDESYTYYSYNVDPKDSNVSYNRVRAMIRNALEKLHDEKHFDFGDLWPDSSEPEGFTVIHAGGGAESGNENFIWSHQWTFAVPLKLDGIIFSNYHTEPAGRGENGSGGLIRIGTTCHESLHFLGMPDLYDTRNNPTSAGLGKFCIMAHGSWNGGNGLSPAHPCAWVKKELNWINPKQVSQGTNYIGTSSKDSTAFYKLTSKNFSSKEYFLMENRQYYGFDKKIPPENQTGRGILIYHIDENQPNNEDPTHYLVDVEEADGTADWTKDHLALNKNKGQSSDYYRSGTKTVFNDTCTTSPNSRSYYKSNGEYKPSGIDISQISASGETMSFYVPEDHDFDIFVDELDDNGVNFVSLIMKYQPTKTKDELKDLSQTEQDKIAQYFEFTIDNARHVNSMASLYYTYIESGTVYGIGKNFTGKIAFERANLIIDLNNVLSKSNQEISSIGNISSANQSPLENETSHSNTIKRFTGTTAIENIKKYSENYGTLIYSFDKMTSMNYSYDIIEMTKETDTDDYPKYFLLKGAKSQTYNDLSQIICYPNPARQGYMFIAKIPDELDNFSAEIFTMTAKLVKTFSVNDVIISNINKLQWNCKNDNGADVAPGVYILLIKNKSQKKTFKIAVIR